VPGRRRDRKAFGRGEGVHGAAQTLDPRERRRDDTDLLIRAAAPPAAEPDDASMAAARWAYAKGRTTGWGTDTLPAISWQFQPLPTAQGVAGLVGIRFADCSEPLDPEAAIALERAELMEERARGATRAEADALRTTLLTSLGYDLGTPLTGIRGSLETLRVLGSRPSLSPPCCMRSRQGSARLPPTTSSLVSSW
jgi:two-component system sensor histidine kinase KdpD